MWVSAGRGRCPGKPQSVGRGRHFRGTATGQTQTHSLDTAGQRVTASCQQSACFMEFRCNDQTKWMQMQRRYDMWLGYFGLSKCKIISMWFERMRISRWHVLKLSHLLRFIDIQHLSYICARLTSSWGRAQEIVVSMNHEAASPQPRRFSELLLQVSSVLCTAAVGWKGYG